MFGMLPTLHENQTLYSWCGLAHALNGGTCVRTTSIRLFGAPYAALTHDFPSRLNALNLATSGWLGSPREIALRNTLLGYYLAIAQRSRAEQIIGLLKTGTIPHLKMLLGITASRVGGHHPLKGCRQCMADDEAGRGWAYWHIEHQLPSVFVCIKHNRPLFMAWDPITPVHRRHWVLPRLSHLYAAYEFPVQRETAMTCLTRLATDSEQLMRLPVASLEPECLTRGYQRILQRSGLATRNGNLHIARLVSLVRERYRGLEDLPGMSFLNSMDGQWPGLAASLSRRVSRPGHPLKHLLLVGAIANSWDELLDACTPKAVVAESPEPSQVIESPCIDRVNRFKQLVTVQGKSISAASLSVGVSPTTGTQWAKKLGVTYKSRGRPLPARTSAKVRRLLAKGDSISSIASAAGVSMTTVYRIVESDHCLSEHRRAEALLTRRHCARQHFSALCRTESDQTLKAIRSVPGNSYTWLYRNDHTWLSRMLAEHGRTSSRSR